MSAGQRPQRPAVIGRPELLIFDLGGVLIENVGFERLAEWLGKRADPLTLKGRWLASPAVRDFERGSTTPDVFAARFLDEWGIDRTPAAFLDEFAGWPKGFFEGAEPLLAQLRRRYRVACMTNSNASHWARFEGFHGLFHHAFSSHLSGMVKPDVEAYEHVLEVCSVPAARAAFFDDSDANVEAARRLGLRAFHVVGFADVARAIEREALLS